MNEWVESAWRACTTKRRRSYNTKSKNQNTLISATWRRIARAANKTFSPTPRCIYTRVLLSTTLAAPFKFQYVLHLPVRPSVRARMRNHPFIYLNKPCSVAVFSLCEFIRWVKWVLNGDGRAGWTGRPLFDLESNQTQQSPLLRRNTRVGDLSILLPDD